MRTLETTAETYLTTVASASPQTAENYRHALNRAYAVIGRPVTEWTPADVSNYVAALNASPLAVGSRAAYISAVRSYLRYLTDLEVLPKSHLAVLKRPRVEVTTFNRYVTAAEGRQLIEAARTGTERLAVALLLTTGIRVSEAASLEWRHLYRDPEGRLGLTVHGKGNKVRAVAVPDPLWKLIKAGRRALGTALSDRDTSPLVAARDGTPFTRQGLWKLVRRVAERTGLGKRVSPHWLRHGFGTMAAGAGVSPFQIQVDMGHSKLETSQRYVHWAKGLKDAGAFAVAGTLWGEGGR